MIKEALIGAVSVTTLFMSSPDAEQPIDVSTTTPEITYNLTEKLSKGSPVLIGDELNFQERLLYMRPATPESDKSKAIRDSVQENLEKEEEKRAQDETERLTQEEKQKVEKEWQENFPVFEGNSAESKFLNEISREAVEIAYENNIFPSVMMAQAGLESNWGRSGLAKNYNNLMGTKGTWKGKTVSMRTREEVSGRSIYINAGFSVYDSWSDSLERYGQLLRNGPNGNASFYAGAWRTNAKDYKDATKWLQGRYATDGNYAAKLNRTIERYGLAQFDDIIPLDEELEEIEVIVEPENVLIEAPKGVYEVQEGDSLLSIALTQNIKIKELTDNNALQSPLLEENQWLIVDVQEFVGADEEELEIFEDITKKTVRLNTDNNVSIATSHQAMID